MPKSEPLPAAPGDVVDGRFRIDRLLGRGGMGAVYAAEHLLLKSRVAIKFMLDVGTADSAARFAREAQVTARLTSVHAVRVTDIVTPPDRPAYLVMELLSGRDLGTFLTERAVVPLEEAVGYVLQACDAIAEAHASGVVHRDIKPANLFLARQPDGSSIVKVLDFGLSKLMKSPVGAPALSTTSVVMGSPCYMSPEQLRSAKRVDARADVWAIGVVLYELVTGKLPFDFESLSDLLVAIAADPHVPASVRVSALPAGLDDVFARCFQKKPRDRYGSVLEFARAIAPFAKEVDRGRLVAIERRSTGRAEAVDESERSRGDAASAAGLDSTAMVPQSPITVTVNPMKRRGAAAMGAAVGVLVAVAGIAFVVSAQRTPSRGSSSAAPEMPSVDAAVTATAPTASIVPLNPPPGPPIASSPPKRTTRDLSLPRPKPPPRSPASPASSAGRPSALPSGVLINEQ